MYRCHPFYTNTITHTLAQLPETPYWLLAQRRTADAERSLRWLRGWVPSHAVATEFADMQRYSERSRSCADCQQQPSPTKPVPLPSALVVCTHAQGGGRSGGFWRRTLRDLCGQRTRRPFALIMFCFVVCQFSGMHSIRPYMVQLFEVFRVPLDANWTTVGVGVMSIAANLVVMCTIGVFGKRRLYFFSLGGTAASCLALSAYAWHTMPTGQSSFEPIVGGGGGGGEEPSAANYAALVMFLSLAFCTSVGAAPITWMFLSEVFPFK